MAFGRKRKDEQEEEPATEPGSSQPGGEEATQPAPGVTAEEPVAVPAPGLEPAGPEPETAVEPHAPRSGLDDDLHEAAMPAGDAAAAGVDAESPVALPDQTETHAVGGAAGDPTADAAPTSGALDSDSSPAGTHGDAESLGSVAASPDPAPVPTDRSFHGHGHGHGDAGADEDAGAADKAGAAAAGAQSLIESRPEVLVAGAFAAGLVAARVLGALGGDR
jgi:hypothetical protein